MTLIVYKNKVLAADTRTSISSPHSKDTSCAYCDNPSKAVRDDAVKIKLLNNPTKPKYFRGEKITATAFAGSVKLIERLERIIRSDDDLEKVYASYIAVAGIVIERPTAASALIICEKFCYVANFPKTGAMTVEQHPLDKFLTLGSGSEGANWLNRVLVNSTAPGLINLVMAEDQSVGGKIEYIDFNQTEVLLKEAEKTDPKELMDRLAKFITDAEETFALAAEKVNRRKSKVK